MNHNNTHITNSWATQTQELWSSQRDSNSPSLLGKQVC